MAYGLTKSANLVRASSQYFNTADTAALSITGNWTIEAWVRFTDVPSGADELRTIAAKGNLSTATNTSYDFFFQRLTGTNYLMAQVADTVDVDSQRVTWTPTAGTWYHVAVAWTAATSKFQFFVDGVQQGADQTGTKTSTNDNADDFRIGAYFPSGSPANPWNGDISLVRVWSEGRTATQLNNNKCLVLGATTNLKGEWTLDDVLTDNSGNGQTLTNNNTATFTTSLPATCASVFIPRIMMS